MATCFITACQLPRSCWRKMRMEEGYQKLVLPSSPQRQSGTFWSSNQVGYPMAPARWATVVLTVVTRSQLAIMAAVSTKSQVWLSWQATKRWRKEQPGSCSSPVPFLLQRQHGARGTAGEEFEGQRSAFQGYCFDFRIALSTDTDDG